MSSWLNFDDCKNTYQYKNQFVAYNYKSSFSDYRNQFVSIIDTDNSTLTIWEHSNTFKGLAFFWALEEYFDLKKEKTKNLKREIYDFANGFKVKKWNIFRFLFTNKYRKLKYEISRDQIIYSIFKSEFDTKDQFSFYISESNMQKYENHQFCKREEKNLLHAVKAETIFKQVDRNNNEINKLNDRFKPIEELNSFNTSTALDSLAVTIGILAIILTYDKIFEIIRFIINKLSEIF